MIFRDAKLSGQEFANGVLGVIFSFFHESLRQSPAFYKLDFINADALKSFDEFNPTHTNYISSSNFIALESLYYSQRPYLLLLVVRTPILGPLVLRVQ